MKFTVILCTALTFCTAISNAVVLPFLETPKHDGVKRVCKLTAENFTTIVSAAEIAVVIFRGQEPASGVQSSCPSESDNFAELTALVLRKKNIVVCTSTTDVTLVAGTGGSTTTSSGTATQYNAGDVYIFKKGLGKPYYGKRSTSALLSFLFKVNSTQINIITGKLDKIAFDAVTEPKVVGFFMKGTVDYQVYEEAASALSPSIRFYVAFDRVVAQHLKLTTVGQIQLVKPPSKFPVVCPNNPASAADIETFLSENKGALLTKINEYNLYDPQLVDPTRTLVLAIGEELSSVGGYFHHLITKLVRNNTNTTDFQKLNIVWIEPQLFPSIYLMMDELQATLGIPNKFPAFGALNLTTLQSAWMDASSLNLTADKTADEQNLALLQDFLNGVITNTVVPVQLGTQAFVQSPVLQTVVEGSDVVLECVVENPIGDCLWLKDGRNIGFNLARYAYYDWRGDRTAGDCSLKITGVQKGRDEGEWVCEITGDLNNPTLTSQPAKLIISASPTSIKSEL